MFIFYDIEYLCLLGDVRQLSLIKDDGYRVFVPHMQIEGYSSEIKEKVRQCEQGKLIEMLDCYGFDDFLNEYSLTNSVFGKGFLFLLHCCKVKNTAIIIDNNRLSQVALCKKLKIKTISIEEFNRQVIRNEEYYNFLMTNKDKIMV